MDEVRMTPIGYDPESFSIFFRLDGVTKSDFPDLELFRYPERPGDDLGKWNAVDFGGMVLARYSVPHPMRMLGDENWDAIRRLKDDLAIRRYAHFVYECGALSQERAEALMGLLVSYWRDVRENGYKPDQRVLESAVKSMERGE